MSVFPVWWSSSVERVKCDSREGDDDEEGSVDSFVLHEVGDECNGLDGFSQTHFISQNAI